MEEKWKAPKVGTTCPALYKENYKYHLSGECTKFCICLISGKACKGRAIADTESRTSQFFSRAKCLINEKKIKKCPLFGSSKELFLDLLKKKSQDKLEKKIKHISEFKK